GRSPRVQRVHRRAEGHHRDGPPVRRRADPAQRRALRPRGRVPAGHRRPDEGARAVRGHDPRGVRRDGAGPDDLRDDRGGALARLDLDLGDRQHALHRLLPAHEVRHRGAEAEVPAPDGDRRVPRRVQPLRARDGLRRASAQGDRDEARRRLLRAQRPEDVGHERPALADRLRARAHRSQGRPALQGHELLHRREAAGRVGEHRPVRRLRRAAAAEEDGLQGRRVDRARLRRLQVPGREHPRRRGGRPEPRLSADDGRAGGRSRERRCARRRDRPARARARAALLAGAQGLRQADRPAPGDPVQARRHGDADRGGAAADAQGGAHEGRGGELRARGRDGEALRLRGRALLRRGVLSHPRRLRLLQGVRDRAPVPRRAAAADRRGHIGDPEDGHRAQAAGAQQDL
ncbi:MAG: Acyl-CoA dehydrogenase, partial [uncultured Solirubrobacteraceae bacterium]